MRIKWRTIPPELPKRKHFRYTCELRQSEKHAHKGKVTKQRKITVAYLGSVSCLPKSVPSQQALDYFAKKCARTLRRLRLGSDEARLARAVRERFPLETLRKELGAGLSRYRRPRPKTRKQLDRTHKKLNRGAPRRPSPRARR